MQNPILLVNHIGYEPSSAKKVIFQSRENRLPETFCIRNSNSEILFEGKFTVGGKTDQWHTGFALTGDFSDFQSEGYYQISCNIENQEIRSFGFRIEQNILQNSCLPLLLEGFQSRHPEEKYEEKDKQISFLGDRNDLVDVQGGWYDASGDVSKYLSHLSFSNFMNPQQIPLVVWTMFEAAEKQDHGNSVNTSYRSELKQEACYGADFLVRMQDPEGYFYMTVFDNWSGDPEKREICSYKGQNGVRSTDYQAGFRQGGGMAIAALARAGRAGVGGEFSKEQYIQTAVFGFDHLLINNLDYLDDKTENIIDDYCFLLAAVELYKTIKDERYLDHSRIRSQMLINRLYTDSNYSGWWRADEEGLRPFFHASDAGLPLIALCKFLEIEEDKDIREEIILSIQTAVDFEIEITNEITNPFGYPRQYIKAVDETEPKTSFFIPHNNETGYWWQGENARIASLASALLMARSYLTNESKKKADVYARDQINWILGLNPYNTCMLDGIGHNNPEYIESVNVNYRGGICNGITSGFKNESDIAFMPLPHNNDPTHQWRWSEQWIPHAAWFMLALSHL
jgi:hypothetical protein